MNGKKQCIAMVREAPNYCHKHQCRNGAKPDDVLCGVHRRKLDKHNEGNAKYGLPPTTPGSLFR